MAATITMYRVEPMIEPRCIAGHPWSALAGTCAEGCGEVQDHTGEPSCPVCGWISAGHTCCPPLSGGSRR
jgi:hypothetical protein